VQVKRAYKFRACPAGPQEGRAGRLLREHCDLYNAALEERREAWGKRRVSIFYGGQSAQLRDIRAADPDGQGRHSFTARQQTLRRMNVVFAAFCKRAGKGGAGYLRYRPYIRFGQGGVCCGGRLEVAAARWRPVGVRDVPGGWPGQGPRAPPRQWHREDAATEA
jgi:hypothetical protein